VPCKVGEVSRRCRELGKQGREGGKRRGGERRRGREGEAGYQIGWLAEADHH